MTRTLTGSGTGTVGVPNSSTAQNSTSGTAITFTGIPAGIKRITLMLAAVSTNGGSHFLIRLGSGGSVTTTGYLGAATQIPANNANSTTGFMILNGSVGTADVINGLVTMALVGSNTWVASGSVGQSDAGRMQFTAGSIALSGELDRVVFTTVNGTDTFDAGSINIIYE